MLNKKYSIIFLLIPLVAALIILFNKLEYSPDDTYIYLQYSRNIAQGNGFSFNPGEPSYGITSPLWAVILTVPYLLGFEGYWLSKILDLFFVLLSAIMFFKLSGLMMLKLAGYDRENRITLQYLSTCILLLNPWFLRWAFTGLETSFAVFIILTLFYSAFKERYYLSSLLAASLFLIRPESIVLFFVLLFYLLLYKKRWKEFLICILLYAMVIAPWIVYAKYAFGTIIPNTALGKSTFTFNLKILLEQLKRIAGTIAFSDALQFVFSTVFVVYIIKKKQLKDYSLIVFWLSGLIILYVITDSDIISRYLLIMLPFFTLLGVQILCVFPSKQKILALCLFIVVLIQSQALYYLYIQPHTNNFTYGLKTCLIPIGTWLKGNTPQDSKVLVNDVGAIGYYSERYIIDAAALINRDLDLNKEIMATPVNERENTANLLGFIKADYLVQRDPFPETKLSESYVYKLDFIYSLKFPGLGISDPSPRFYKVYKVVSKE